MTTKGNYREARLTGARKYVGEPCKHCGNEVRYTANACCVTCASSRKQTAKAQRKEITDATD